MLLQLQQKEVRRMSKLYVNGYDHPRFEIVQPDNSIVTHDISFKYQALKEYYTAVGDLVKIIDGSKVPWIDHYEYEWELSLIDYAESPDLLKLTEVEKAAARGLPIYLTPHHDHIWRKFRVLVLPERREIDQHYHHGGADNTANKGYIITFVNAERITEIQTEDGDFLPLISAESCFEF
ncbi:hypothetical protein D4R99_03440 [bacterium]|nr:MAG: hypothetical protein D4R99_03440 [bacterium]